ncbi:MAG: right-handed parallel beta-helix repeat-containing protein [Chitinophagales bacterium]
MQKIEAKRQEALQAGILNTNDDVDWVKGVLLFNDSSYSCEARLKGDWPDHLIDNNWSFRIKLKGDAAVMGMQTFSVQDPFTRDYLNEWVYHQWLMYEDILTPRYDFVSFALNNNTSRIYAIEEHFDKNLLESQNRREGPIVKFSEEGMWNLRGYDIENDIKTLRSEEVLPTYAIAEIEPFSKGQTLKSDAMKSLFENAQTLMTQYRNGKVPFSQVFDLEKMAKYFAISDVAKAYHGLIWHNLRFYFNPISQKLEPIGFDGYSESGVFDFIHRPFIGYGVVPVFKEEVSLNGTLENFFHEQEFVELYAKYLNTYTDSTYIKTFFNSISDSILSREKLLSMNQPGYKYSDKIIKENSAIIHNIINPSGDNILKVYREEFLPGKQIITCINNFCLPVQVVGISPRKDDVAYYFETPVKLDAFNEYTTAPSKVISANGEGDYVFYKVPGIDSFQVTSMKAWQAPFPQTPSQELFSNIKIESNSLYSVEGNKIYLRQGKHQVNKPIVIPEGYTVYASPATEFDFVNEAAFISRSPVVFKGSSDQPVRIFSSDSSAMGFTVLQAKQKSYLDHVVFDKLNTLNYKGWTLLGAVNIFESEIEISHTSIVHNQCEDALNIIRSKFTLTDSYIGFTFGDAFDADFTTGEVKNCYIYHTNNDGLDFSGSKIFVENCRMENIGDKGLSCGENSLIHIKDTHVNHASVGVASKDLSHVTVENVAIKNSGKAFSAYIKKTAFGPAKIRVISYTAENVKELSTALDGSEIILPGK